MMFIEHGPVQRLKKPSEWSSYGVKHAAERWGRALGFEPYVSNGDLLAACLALGVSITKPRAKWPNSGVALKEVEKGAGYWERSYA